MSFLSQHIHALEHFKDANEDHYSIIKSFVSDNAVCRTAQATPVLLILTFSVKVTEIIYIGQFLRDSRTICTIKVFHMIIFERMDDSKLHLYIGFW